MHLLFARFIGHFLYKEHYVSNPEPFDYLITQGMVQSETYVNKVTKGYEKPEDVEKRGKQFYKKGTNEEVEVKYVKMSKIEPVVKTVKVDKDGVIDLSHTFCGNSAVFFEITPVEK